MEIQHQIHLTEQQQKIFDTFIKYKKQLKLQTVFRVAGGWVRDKLMKKQSHDIDIALDNMKGQQFINLLQKHADEKGQKIHGFGVTKFNPQMSKHLQTATLKLFDHAIDIVNLRSQKYSQHSRIPQIDIGTPKQDAQRRDLTINSMFYNIETKEVQDWTGKGFQDLQNGRIRTPLKPYQTFLDDPLRILRCFRFAGRFGFKVDQDIQEAIKNKEIRDALQYKVSKERIGTELSGMLKAYHVLDCLLYVKRNHLWNLIFQIPKESDLAKQGTEELFENIPEYSYKCLEMFLKNMNQNKLISEESLIQVQNKEIKQKKQKKQEQVKPIQMVDESQQKIQQKPVANLKKDKKKKQKTQKPKKVKEAIKYSREQLKILMRLSCLLVFYRNYKKHLPKNREQSLIDHMVLNQLKYPAKYAKFVSKIGQSINLYEKIQSLKDINKIIKWLRVSEEKWQIVLHLMEGINELENRKDKITFSPMEMRKFVLQQSLQNAFLVQAHIDGNFLTSKGKKGPIVGVILDNCITWRILNPKSQKQNFIQFFNENIQFFEDQNAYA